MSLITNNVPNLRTVNALRGESLTIDLGKTFSGGVLTAWMKKNPNDTTYREFEVIDGRYLFLTKERASDYYAIGTDTLLEEVEGKWFWDLRLVPTGGNAELEEILYTGTILFKNQVTDSRGTDITNPDTEGYIKDFIALHDTPASYGTAGQILVVTNSEDGLRFVDNVLPYNDAALIALINGKVDDNQVLTNVPFGALFTDTVYSDIDLKSRVSQNEADIEALQIDEAAQDILIDGVKTKTDFITITQAVDLDALESENSLNNDKVSNIPTSLQTGTRNSTQYGITSDGAVDDIVLLAATPTQAGVLTSAKLAEIVANSLKEGVSVGQALIISNTSGTNTGDQDISGIAANALDIAALEISEAAQDILIDNNKNKLDLLVVSTPVDLDQLFLDTELNNNKISNLPTVLQTGTRNSTQYGITSDGAVDDMLLFSATPTLAGLLTAEKYNEIVANKLKVGLTPEQIILLENFESVVAPTLEQVLTAGKSVYSPDLNSFIDFNMLVDAPANYINWVIDNIIGIDNSSFYFDSHGLKVTGSDEPEGGELWVGKNPYLRTINDLNDTYFKMGAPAAANVEIFLNTPSSTVDNEDIIIPLSVNGHFADNDGNIKLDLQEPDGLLRVGVIAQSGLNITVGVNEFRVTTNEIEALNTVFAGTVVAATSSFNRIDILEISPLGIISIVQGVENAELAFKPSVTIGSYEIGTITITGNTIDNVINSGARKDYVEKDEFAFLKVSGTGDKAEVSVNGTSTAFHFPEADSVSSISVAYNKRQYVYSGKKVYIRNSKPSGDLTIFNNSGTGNYKFFFADGNDLTIIPGQIVEFMFRIIDNAGGFLDQVGVGSSGGGGGVSGTSVSVRYEVTWTGGTQEFTTPTDYLSVSSVIVNGLTLSNSQYSLSGTNKVTILDTLDVNDYVIIIYGTTVALIADPAQITITTAVNITTDTLGNLGKAQKEKNVIIDNGVNAINLLVNGGEDFMASYVKNGTGAINFSQKMGRTLVLVDGTQVLDGAVGSTATISSIGTVDYLRISNA
jgi:hypothetical protein